MKKIEPVYYALEEDDQEIVFKFALNRLYPGYKMVKEREKVTAKVIIEEEKPKIKRKRRSKRPTSYRIPVNLEGVAYDSVADGARAYGLKVAQVHYFANKWHIRSDKALARIIKEHGLSKKKVKLKQVTNPPPDVVLTVGGQALEGQGCQTL